MSNYIIQGLNTAVSVIARRKVTKAVNKIAEISVSIEITTTPKQCDCA
jgi:hypothetical protein